MRTVNFKNDVLWPIAYRLGVDPRQELLSDQANAVASYINSWVRRLWDAADWPEWTITAKFAPTTAPGVEHIVTWNAPPLDYTPPSMGPDAPGPNTIPPKIGKVLKVYLLDPRTTRAPVDTPFRLNHLGIHCGFEHGTSVWIKYVARCPQFTSNPWIASVIYNKDALVYSPVSGECYVSKSNNNLGHDPAQPGGGEPFSPLSVQETGGTADNPGLPATAQIIDIFAAPQTPGSSPIPDPPPNGYVFTIEVRDATNVFLGDATHTATGAQSLSTIFTDLRTQLAAEALMSSFTVTLVTSPTLKIRLQNASNYVISKAQYGPASPTLPLLTVQAQPYVPATAPSSGIGQSFKLTIAPDQFMQGAIYTLTFTTVDSNQHIASYTAASTDNTQQVLAGLINAMIALQTLDPFFTGVQSALDTVGPSATFTINKTLGNASLDAIILAPGSTYWDLVPFPFVLADQVVRGAGADVLGEQGQTDKKAVEEQAVKTEFDVRTGAFTAPKHDALTDQYQGDGKSRYET